MFSLLSAIKESNKKPAIDSRSIIAQELLLPLWQPILVVCGVIPVATYYGSAGDKFFNEAIAVFPALITMLIYISSLQKYLLLRKRGPAIPLSGHKLVLLKFVVLVITITGILYSFLIALLQCGTSLCCCAPTVCLAPETVNFAPSSESCGHLASNCSKAFLFRLLHTYALSILLPVLIRLALLQSESALVDKRVARKLIFTLLEQDD